MKFQAWISRALHGRPHDRVAHQQVHFNSIEYQEQDEPPSRMRNPITGGGSTSNMITHLTGVRCLRARQIAASGPLRKLLRPHIPRFTQVSTLFQASSPIRTLSPAMRLLAVFVGVAVAAAQVNALHVQRSLIDGLPGDATTKPLPASGAITIDTFPAPSGEPTTIFIASGTGTVFLASGTDTVLPASGASTITDHFSVGTSRGVSASSSSSSGEHGSTITTSISASRVTGSSSASSQESVTLSDFSVSPTVTPSVTASSTVTGSSSVTDSLPVPSDSLTGSGGTLTVPAPSSSGTPSSVPSGSVAPSGTVAPNTSPTPTPNAASGLRGDHVALAGVLAFAGMLMV